MNDFAIGFVLINAVALLLLPRRWAPLPLLIGACYMTLGQGVELGPFSFTIIRMLVGVGVVRVIIRGERLKGRMNGLDWLMVVWAMWALISSVFHNEPSEALIFRLGLAYNTCGIYFLVRIFCQTLDDILYVLRNTAILLVPLALIMFSEKITGRNPFFIFGGVPEYSSIRDGIIRATGPFSHSILAGTVGAVCLPLMIGLWQQYRKIAITGIFACVIMVYASASSGPILSAIAPIWALLMWPLRHWMRFVKWLAIFGYIGLDLVMKAPAYYLIGRIKPLGVSAGYHRAALIESAIKHIDEWWLAGTDSTRHWMPTGVSWSPDHTDITNHFIKMGTLGGLPLMLLFIFILIKGFSFLGQTLKETVNQPLKYRFMIWSLGSALFAQTATCIAVSYFDQSFIFLYLTLAAISSARSAVLQSRGIHEPDRQVPSFRKSEITG